MSDIQQHKSDLGSAGQKNQPGPRNQAGQRNQAGPGNQAGPRNQAGQRLKKKQAKKTYLLLGVILVLGLAVVFVIAFMNHLNDSGLDEIEEKYSTIEKYDDVRCFRSSGLTDKADISEANYSHMKKFNEILPYVRFNDFTVWPDKAQGLLPKDAIDPKTILEKGKKLGLNMDKVKRHYDGSGVNIAIIDLNIHTDNPEYANSIKDYKVFGDTQVEGSGLSTSLISLVAGKTTGVAPGVGIYYAAIAIEEMDVKYYLDAMKWLEEINKTLPEQEKIRLVMIPATLHGDESPFDTNVELWSEIERIAELNGMRIIDSSSSRRFGSCYRDLNHPNDYSKVKMGYPDSNDEDTADDLVLFPSSMKTVAEEYEKGVYGFQYVPKSAVSWSMAECVGAIAVGYEILGDKAGNYSPDFLIDYMYKTARVLNNPDTNNPDTNNLDLPPEKCHVIDMQRYVSALEHFIDRGSKD